MACRRYPHLPRGRVEHGVRHGGHDIALEILHFLIQLAQDDRRIRELQRVRAQGTAHPAHDDRTPEPGTGHVTDHHAQLTPGQAEHVIPVTADRAVPRHVAGGNLHPPDHGQRRGQQAALKGRRGGTVLAGPQRLHRQRRAVGGKLKQRGIVGREDPVVHRADVQYPDHRAMDQQRHAHQGLNSFVQQNRVEHIGLIHVVQDDRPPLGRDTPSETPANRDPHALPDFLLQAAGCRRDQLTPRAVQQQHRYGVSVQNLLHPAQQLGEKVIDAKMGQRHIRNRPDVPELVFRIWWRAQRRCHEERLPPP